MKNYLEKFNYATSKSAIERHTILKKISKKYDFENLLEVTALKIKRTPKSQINNIKILRADLKWIRNFLKQKS